MENGVFIFTYFQLTRSLIYSHTFILSLFIETLSIFNGTLISESGPSMTLSRDNNVKMLVVDGFTCLHLALYIFLKLITKLLFQASA